MTTEPDDCTCVRGVELRSQAEIDAEIDNTWQRLIGMLKRAGYEDAEWYEEDALSGWRFDARRRAAPEAAPVAEATGA